MTGQRRIAGENSKNRAVLLDAAERLMLEHGYAAVTSRKLAVEAGLKPQLVHYYFKTMDDLFLEVFRRRAEQNLVRHAEVLASAEPLRALWDFDRDKRGVALHMEFLALGNHRKPILHEIARYAELFREAEVSAIDRVLRNAGVDVSVFPPAMVALLVSSISRVVVLEQAMGFTVGHDEMVAVVERCLDQLASG